MQENETLKFNEKDLFNNQILQQYNKDGQLGFLGYLLRHKQWKISEKNIEFIDISSENQIEKLLKEYSTAVRKYNIKEQKYAVERANFIGNENYIQTLNKRLESLEREKRKLNDKQR